MKRTLLLSVLTMLCFSNLVVAQEAASIEGFIKDAKTGEHLLSANVAVQEVKKGISSDVEGFFALEDLSPGEYTLVCSYLGYQQYEETIVLEPGETLQLNVELVPKSMKMDEIVVQSKARSIERSHISAKEVSMEMMQNLPVIESDVFQSLQMLPGIQASSDYSSNLYVRGGSPDQTLILLDNTPVFSPTHFFGFFSTFNPDMINDVQLYKGAYPAKFGGRLGSVLTLNSQRGNTSKTAGSVTASMLASRVALEGPMPKGSWKITGRRSTIGPVLDVLRESTSGIPDEYSFYDMNGRFDIAPNAKNLLTLNIYAGQDDILFPVTGTGNLDMVYGNRVASLNWKHQFRDNLFTNLTFTGSQHFKESSISQGGMSKSKENDIEEYSAKFELEYLPVSRHRISTGLSASLTRVNLLEEMSQDGAVRHSIENPLATAYVQDEWQPTEKWKFTPGIRFSYFENGDYLHIQPRFTAEFIPSDKLIMHASYGHYNQFMSMMTKEAFTGFDMWLSASEGVSPSTGIQYVGGISSTPFMNFGFDLEIYYREMHDLFEMDPYVWDKSTKSYSELFRIGDGYAYGLEAFLEKKAGRITGFVGYSLGYTWRKFPGYNVNPGAEKPEAMYYPPKYDRRHDLTLALNYALNDTWEFTTVFTYATGQAYTKVTGRYATVNFPHVPFRENVFVVDKVNASRLPAYHRLDVSLSRKGQFFGMAESELKIQAINAYSRRNIWFYNYSFVNNPVERKEIKLLPVIPVLSLTINF